jgi:hypothetical protein
MALTFLWVFVAVRYPHVGVQRAVADCGPSPERDVCDEKAEQPEQGELLRVRGWEDIELRRLSTQNADLFAIIQARDVELTRYHEEWAQRFEESKVPNGERQVAEFHKYTS